MYEQCWRASTDVSRELVTLVCVREVREEPSLPLAEESLDEPKAEAREEASRRANIGARLSPLLQSGNTNTGGTLAPLRKGPRSK